MIRIILTSLLLSLVITSSKAQYSFTSSVSGSIYFSSVQSLTLTGGTGIPTLSSSSDFMNGIEMTNYLTATIKSNVPWTLSVQSTNSFFTPMNGGSTNMPASVLGIKTTNDNNYTSLSTNSVTLKTGNKGSGTTPGNSFSLDLKFNPGFSYQGGIYTLGLMYTLSEQ